MGDFHRHLCPGETGQRLAKARLGIARTGSETDAAARQRSDRTKVLASVVACTQVELLRGCSGLVNQVCAEVDINEKSEKWRSAGTRHIDLAECSFEDVSGKGRLTVGETNGGERSGDLRVGGRIQTFEQLFCLLDPALPDAQVGQPHQCAAA